MPTKRDPTGTLRLRRNYAAAVSGRMETVRAAMRAAVVEDDAFNLEGPATLQDFGENDGERIEAFIAWLDAQHDETVLEIAAVGVAVAAWQLEFIRAAYIAGIVQADAKLARIGVDLSPTRFLPGPLDTPMRPDPLTIIRQPRHASALGLEAALNRNELRRILLEASRRTARAAADGLRQGLPAAELAAALDQAYQVGIQRGRTLAAARVVGAHAEATLLRFEDAGVEKVAGVAEFVTADDEDVCPRCRALEGRIFRIPEARGIIPVHEYCRCTWLPLTAEMVAGNTATPAVTIEFVRGRTVRLAA